MDMWSDINLTPFMAVTAHWIETTTVQTPQGPNTSWSFNQTWLDFSAALVAILGNTSLRPFFMSSNASKLPRRYGKYRPLWNLCSFKIFRLAGPRLTMHQTTTLLWPHSLQSSGHSAFLLMLWNAGSSECIIFQCMGWCSLTAKVVFLISSILHARQCSHQSRNIEMYFLILILLQMFVLLSMQYVCVWFGSYGMLFIHFFRFGHHHYGASISMRLWRPCTRRSSSFFVMLIHVGHQLCWWSNVHSNSKRFVINFFHRSFQIDLF